MVIHVIRQMLMMDDGGWGSVGRSVGAPCMQGYMIGGVQAQAATGCWMKAKRKRENRRCTMMSEMMCETEQGH